jgi:hypothetical protein
MVGRAPPILNLRIYGHPAPPMLHAPTRIRASRRNLGDGFLEHLAGYFWAAWSLEVRPLRSQGATHAAGWPDTPQPSQPYPFTEQRHGGATNRRVNRPSVVDAFGGDARKHRRSDDHHLWPGQRPPATSTRSARRRLAGTLIAIRPHAAQLDQAALYFERLPDSMPPHLSDRGRSQGGPTKCELTLLIRRR